MAVASYIVARRTGRNPIRGWQLLLLSLVSFLISLLQLGKIHSQNEQRYTKHIDSLYSPNNKHIVFCSQWMIERHSDINSVLFERRSRKANVSEYPICFASLFSSMEQSLSRDATRKTTASGRNDESNRRSKPHTRTSGNDTAASWDFILYILYISSNAQTQNDRACQLPKSSLSILSFF